MENIAEILKNAPQGLKLYSLVHGDVTLNKGINTNNNYPVITTCGTDNHPATFTKYGKFIKDFEDADCILFPSKDRRTWDNWQDVLFQTGDVIVSQNETPVGFQRFLCYENDVRGYLAYGVDGGKNYITPSYYRYATPEEREQFFNELNRNGYTWNDNTKQMEKSLQDTPKYKVGDWIKHLTLNNKKEPYVLYKIIGMGDTSYQLELRNGSQYNKLQTLIENETYWELATEQELIDAGIKCSNSEHNTNIDNQLKNNTFYYPEQETEVEVTSDGCYKCVLKTEKKKPKFSIGDYIVGDDETIYKIMDIHSALYTLYDYRNQNKFKQTIKKIDENYSLVTDKELIDAGIKNQQHKFKANKHYVTPNRMFFNWIYDRLVNLHGENPDVDYMLSLKERIDDLFPETEETGTTSEPTEEKQFTIDDFKPFDKVLVQDMSSHWTCDFYIRYDNTHKLYACITSTWDKCIPYNDETKHLLGTTDDYKGKYKTWGK